MGNKVIVERFHVQEPSLTYIGTGQKTLEIRVGTAKTKRIKQGDHVLFTNNRSKRFIRRVVAIRMYTSFTQMLQTEPLDKIAPASPVAGRIMMALCRFYPPEMERLGVYVLELQPSSQ